MIVSLLPRAHLNAGLALAAAFIAFLAAASAAEQPNEGKRWSDERVLIQLRQPSPVATGNPDKRSAQEWAARLELPPGVTFRSMKRPGGDIATAEDVLEVERPIVVELNGTLPVPAAIALLRQHADVQFVEPDYVGSGAGRPSDPSYGSQWHHQKIQSEAAWDITTGSSNVIVAVLDTGLTTGAEFSGRVVSGGYDYVNNDTLPVDDHGHGTAVAGVAAANANNGTLVAGVNWGCRVLPYKVLDAQNNGFYSRWAQAIYDAADAGAKVINLSAGGHEDSATLAAAIDYAISRGAIFITISHNDGAGVVRFPGRLPQCITVGATERDDTRAAFSNYGAGVDLVAPGRDIYTVGRTGALQFWFGTSFAAPQVSGVAASIAGLNPAINQRQMEQLLTASAQDGVGGSFDTAGWDQYFGYGRLNAKYALDLGSRRAAPAQPLNVSTRARVLAGDERAMIGGIIITGAHAKNTLIRAVGPSLSGAGVEGALQDPALQLFDSSGAMIASNDNWRESQPQDIEATTIAPRDDRESALVRILSPGSYTAVVRGKEGAAGVALVEAYDLQQTPNSKLANISTRAFVNTGEHVVIGGFIVGAASNYVVRAIGPSLRNSGVSDALDNPFLELRDADGNLRADNDDWQTHASASQVEATGLAPQNATESAVYLQLPGGSYTAIVRGSNDQTGVALVEVYNVL